MASIPLSLLAGFLGPKILKTIASESGNVHSLETTEEMATAMKPGPSSEPTQTQLNVPLVTQNMVKQNAGGVISADQMQASSVATVRELMSDATQLATFTISPTTPIGTVLYSTEVCPARLTGSNETRITYLSKLFSYWRGSFRFRFVYTKTLLIQCKIAAVFVPGATKASPPPTPASTTYFKHHVIMNPANEEQYDLEVPFISTTPFNKMADSTGMLYVLVWQPLVVSIGDANTLPVTMLCSSTDLDFHEYAVVPTYDNPILPAVGSEYMYVYLQVSAPDYVFVAADTGSVSILSDSGANLVAKASKLNAAKTDWNFSVRTPALASPVYTSTETYSLSTCRTVFGTIATGTPAIWQRYVFAPAATAASSDKCCGFRVCITASGSIWIQPYEAGASTANVSAFAVTLPPIWIFPQYIYASA